MPQEDENKTPEKYYKDDPGSSAWEQAQKAEGYDPDADAYIYVVSFLRKTDDQRFFYVGMTQNCKRGLQHQINDKVRYPEKIDKPVLVNGEEQMRRQEGGYVFEEVIKIKSLHNPDAKVPQYKEWKTRGEIALKYNTVNVLGGR